jgi:potassium-transporting ATPase KdpC subunit
MRTNMKPTTEHSETHASDAKDVHEDTSSFFRHVWASIASTILLVAICCGLYPIVIWGIAQLVFPNQANGSLVKKDGTYTVKNEEAVGSSLLGQNFSLPGYFNPRPSAANNSAGSSFSSSGGYDPTSSGGTNLGPLSDELINGAVNTPAPTTAPTTAPAPTLAFDGIRLRTIHYAVNNNLLFKLYNVSPDGSRVEVPLAKFEDGSGNLLDTALVTAFPHPPSDTPDRVVLVAGDFKMKKADGSTAPVLIPADAVTSSASGLDPHISPANAAIQAQRVADTRHISVDKVTALITAHTDGPSLGFIGDPGVNVLLLNLDLDAKYPLPTPVPTTSAPSTQPSAK